MNKHVQEQSDNQTVTLVTQLLPPNTTSLERTAAQALGNINEIPLPIRSLGSAKECPLPLLPYLAWARSVDRWDTNWSENTKRVVTQDAFFVHQRKGTIGALRRAVAPFGFLLHVKEWWQSKPPTQPGTFHLDIGVRDTGIDEAAYAELARLIDDAKPLSRHLVGLAISLETRGSVSVVATCHDGGTMTIYPPSSAAIKLPLAIACKGCLHMIDTVHIYPHTLSH